MSIAINEHHFEGPYQDPSNLKNKAGVFAVMVWKGDYWRLLDLGQSENIVDALKKHPRQDEWLMYSKKKQRAYAAFYLEDTSKREAMEASIRELSKPPCGT